MPEIRHLGAEHALHDLAIAHDQDAVRAPSDRRIMGHDDERPAISIQITVVARGSI